MRYSFTFWGIPGTFCPRATLWIYALQWESLRHPHHHERMVFPSSWRLYIPPMYCNFTAGPGISEGAAPEGYSVPPKASLLRKFYIISLPKRTEPTTYWRPPPAALLARLPFLKPKIRRVRHRPLHSHQAATLAPEFGTLAPAHGGQGHQDAIKVFGSSVATNSLSALVTMRVWGSKAFSSSHGYLNITLVPKLGSQLHSLSCPR